MAATVLTLADLKDLQTNSPAYAAKMEGVREREQRLDTRRELMKQLVTYITSRAEPTLREAAEAGRGDTIIFDFRPVMKDPEDKSRKLFDPAECYWSGLTESGERVSANTGGVPFSVLVFGARVKGPDGRMYNDPSTLPDGKTLGKLLEEHYTGCKVVSRYNRERQQGTVRLVWDLEAWAAREARLRASRAAQPKRQRSQQQSK